MQSPNESERFRTRAAGRRLVSAHKAMLARNAVSCAARGITAAPNQFLINKSDKMEAGNPRKLRPQASEGNLAQRLFPRMRYVRVLADRRAASACRFCFLRWRI